MKHRIRNFWINLFNRSDSSRLKKRLGLIRKVWKLSLVPTQTKSLAVGCEPYACLDFVVYRVDISIYPFGAKADFRLTLPDYRGSGLDAVAAVVTLVENKGNTTILHHISYVNYDALLAKIIKTALGPIGSDFSGLTVIHTPHITHATKHSR